MAFSSLFIHMVWSTKERLPQLTPALRSTLFAYMGGIVRNHRGHPEIINGVEDHVHALFRIPTSMSVADMARQLKSSTSRLANEEAGKHVLQWQTKYGAFSVNPREIDVVRDYIANQVHHHRKVSFKEEMQNMLDEFGLKYDEQYMWE